MPPYPRLLCLCQPLGWVVYFGGVWYCMCNSMCTTLYVFADFFISQPIVVKLRLHVGYNILDFLTMSNFKLSLKY